MQIHGERNSGQDPRKVSLCAIFGRTPLRNFNFTFFVPFNATSYFFIRFSTHPIFHSVPTISTPSGCSFEVGTLSTAFDFYYNLCHIIELLICEEKRHITAIFAKGWQKCS
jgi:hypothetical protein